MIRPALLLLLALAAAPAQAQRSLTIKRFDATIVVTPDGSVDVTESITARFTGSWNGIFRTVPVEYRTPQGFNWTLRLDLLGVTDGDGRPLEVESSRERHYIKYRIRVPGAVDATRTVLIRYRAANGLRFLEDHDELYWNVTGDEWDVPIEAATARIELPAAATGVRAIAFNGVYGSTARDAVVKTEGTTVRVAMPHRLDFHEGLTAVVGWDKGLVAPPSEAEQAVGFLASNWPLGIPILVFLAMFTLWRRVGRDPRRLPVAVQYEPPDSITPAEAGTLMDESADMRDVTATVTDLAVRGHLRIEEREQSALFGLITRQEYVFHRLEPAGLPPLVAHEEQVLRGIFARGKNEVRLSELENEFYKVLPAVKTQIFERLVKRGLYRSRPDQVKSRWRVGAIVVGWSHHQPGRRPQRQVPAHPGAVRPRGAGHRPHRFPVQQVHARSHHRRRPHPRAPARLRGVPVAGREGALRAGGEDAGDVRALSAVRHGVRRGAEVGQGVSGHLPGAAQVVRRQQLVRLRPGPPLQQPVRPVEPRAERDDLFTAQLEWIGLQQRRVVRRGDPEVVGEAVGEGGNTGSEVRAHRIRTRLKSLLGTPWLCHEIISQEQRLPIRQTTRTFGRSPVRGVATPCRAATLVARYGLASSANSG